MSSKNKKTYSKVVEPAAEPAAGSVKTKPVDVKLVEVPNALVSKFAEIRAMDDELIAAEPERKRKKLEKHVNDLLQLTLKKLEERIEKGQIGPVRLYVNEIIEVATGAGITNKIKCDYDIHFASVEVYSEFDKHLKSLGYAVTSLERRPSDKAYYEISRLATPRPTESE